MSRLHQPRVLVTSLFCCGSLLALGCTGTIGERVGGGPGTPGAASEPGGPAAPGDLGSPGTAAAPAPSGACSGDQLGPSPLHRLTRVEYDNSIRDLIGED